MAACCTLREFGARFLKENWKLFIAGYVIGHVLVVYWFGITFIVLICTYKLAYDKCLFERLWVVNPETQSDEWVVKFKSWVVNHTWYNIKTDTILELSSL